MIDDQGSNQPSAGGRSPIFVVRLGGENAADFAICEQVGIVPRDRRLPGSGKTVAELVEEQALLAAAISSGDLAGLKELLMMAATGENELDKDD